MIGSNPNRKTISALALDELKKKEDLESLRKYLISENCFPPTKDVDSCPISLEDLKKLARAWKLNERRNFWKTHIERDELVAALLQHAEQNQNFLAKKVFKKPESLQPAPPAELKSSLHRNVALNLAIKNFCGIKYFNRENNATELVINSRFFQFPDPEDEMTRVVERWRDEDFSLRDSASQHQAQNKALGSNLSASQSTHVSTSGIKNKVKLTKHRNLAMHLMNYSANPQLDKASMNLKSVQTFINLADTDDEQIVSHCIIALSNISTHEHVRSVLFEINALHKFSNMLSLIKGKVAFKAAMYLFYYFSCDKETEDRVFNSCSSFLQMNGHSKDHEVRQITLYTLINLMPCIDRQRVAEAILKIIHEHFDAIQSLNHIEEVRTFVLAIKSISCFSNAHANLVHSNSFNIITTIAKHAADNNITDIGLTIIDIVHAFLQFSDQATGLINFQFVKIIWTLLSFKDAQVLVGCMKAATRLSTLPNVSVLIQDTGLMARVAQVINAYQDIPVAIAREAANFLLNVTVQQSPADLVRFVEFGVAESILNIIEASSSISPVTKSKAIKGLMNLLSIPENQIKLVSKCITPLTRYLSKQPDISAANCLFNLSCNSQCKELLVQEKIHVQVFDFFTATKLPELKSTFIQVLVQLASSHVCISELLQVDLIHRLQQQLLSSTHGSGIESTNPFSAPSESPESSESSRSIWKDVSLMLLAVVAHAMNSLSEANQADIVSILSAICIEQADPEVIENSSSVLKYISSRYAQFDAVDAVVRAILSLHQSDQVIENLSTVLYNMTCKPDNVDLMLQDEHYVNIMIKILRNGKTEVQEDIAQAMRTLCSVDRCTQILLSTDILSDLIVIALLRTSSEEIKVICSEAFYNMLCHPDTRIRLLEGDLWWAVMRLCRTDSLRVKSVCARALFDLSCDPRNIPPLRGHHVLSFIRDVSASGDEDFVSKCLCAVHNMLRQFPGYESSDAGPEAQEAHEYTENATKLGSSSLESSNSPITRRKELSTVSMQPSNSSSSGSTSRPDLEAELVAAIRIAVGALHRCKSLEAIRNAINLLLFCAQKWSSSPILKKNSTSTNAEFVNFDLIDLLQSCQSIWTQDQESCLNISRLFWELSKSSLFVKSSSMMDIDPILHATFENCPTFEVADNLTSVLYAFIIQQRVGPQDVIYFKVYPIILTEFLSLNHHIQVEDEEQDLYPISASALKRSQTLFFGGSAGSSNSLLSEASISMGGGVGSLPTSLPNGVSPLERRTILKSSKPTPAIVSSVANDQAATSSVINQNVGSQPITPAAPMFARMPTFREQSFNSANPKIIRNAKKTETSQYTKSRALSVLAFSINELIKANKQPSRAQSANQPNSLSQSHMDHQNSGNISMGSFASQTAATGSSIPGGASGSGNTARVSAIHHLSHVGRGPASSKGEAYNIDSPLIGGLLLNSLIDYRNAKINLMVVIAALSTEATYAEYLLEHNVLSILSRYFSNMVGTNKQDAAQEFCSSILRNLSLHLQLIPKLTEVLDGSLTELIRSLVDNSNTAVYLDISVFLFHCNGRLVTKEWAETKGLTPSFVLDIIDKITQNEKDEDIANINKFTLSVILNNYKMGSGVDPSFVQYMYNYIQSNQNATSPELVRNITHKLLPYVVHVVYKEFNDIKKTIFIDLEEFPEDEFQWVPIVRTQYKTNMLVDVKISDGKPLVFDKWEHTEWSSSTNYSKILKQYGLLIEKEAVVISELDDEDDIDDDNESDRMEEQNEGNAKWNNSSALHGRPSSGGGGRPSSGGHHRQSKKSNSQSFRNKQVHRELTSSHSQDHSDPESQASSSKLPTI